MQCRNCGAEIAAKAIICYRCGTATTESVRKAVAIKGRRNPIFSLVLAALLVLLALYMGQASRTAADPGRWQIVAGVLLGTALIVVLLRLLRRR
jgi:hypothetical protein